MAAGAVLAPITWAREKLFNSIGNSIITVVVIAALAWFIPKLIDWAFINAVFEIDPQKCRVAAGACWGFVAEKYRLMFFGTYPFEEQWRPLVMSILLLTLIGLTMNTRLWGRWLWISWVVGIVAMWLLMAGGVPGLPEVETDRWGGLPLTLVLAVNAIFFSFPLAVLLALGRRSDMPFIKTLCIGFIELVRGVPLITVLFMASLMIPLSLPEGMTINKLLRAQVGLILFTAAYVAEVIRGGLQAIPKGQFEAGDALGLSYWQKTGFIILPQALKLVIPPTVNTFIGIFKDTSLVIIIGLFDFLGSVRIASNDPVWRPFYVEGLIVAALVYFTFCYTMAAYSRSVEARLNRQQQR